MQCVGFNNIRFETEEKQPEKNYAFLRLLGLEMDIGAYMQQVSIDRRLVRRPACLPIIDYRIKISSFNYDGYLRKYRRLAQQGQHRHMNAVKC